MGFEYSLESLYSPNKDLKFEGEDSVSAVLEVGIQCPPHRWTSLICWQTKYPQGSMWSMLIHTPYRQKAVMSKGPGTNPWQAVS